MSDTKEKKDNLITVYKAAQSLGIKAEVLQYQIDAGNIDSVEGMVWRYSKKQYEQSGSVAVDTGKSVCTSHKRMVDEENLDDCIEQGHLFDCMGCKYYRPAKAELDTFMSTQQKKADDNAKRVIEFMNNTMNIKYKDLTLEEVFLSVQTDATRYRMGCDIKAEEKLKEWQRLKSIQKTNC